MGTSEEEKTINTKHRKNQQKTKKKLLPNSNKNRLTLFHFIYLWTRGLILSHFRKGTHQNGYKNVAQLKQQ
jgi:hypothetical protein